VGSPPSSGVCNTGSGFEPRRLADSLTLCTYSSRRRHLTLASSQVTGSRKLGHCEVTERTTGQTRAAAPTKPPHEMREYRNR
jgi:hypothetical protein